MMVKSNLLKLYDDDDDISISRVELVFYYYFRFVFEVLKMKQFCFGIVVREPQDV